MGPRLSVSDRQQAINALHPTWHARRIDQLLDWAAETYKDRPYVVTDSGTWSYGQICDWSKQVAAGLIDIGVKAGDHVGLLMANFPEFVAAKYGIARAGATCIPINFLNRRHELAYVLRQSDAVALITMDSFRGLNYLEDLDAICPDWATKGGADTFPLLRNVVVMPTSEDQLPADVLTFEDLCGRGDPEAIDPITYVGADGLADILYTSGTTGEPKGVLLTHDMLLRTAFGSVFGRAFQDGRRITFSLPMYHVYGLVEGMLSVPFVGGAIIPELSFSAASTLEVIGRHHANDVLLIPTMTAAILDAYEKHPATYDLSSLECMITSGGISPPGIWDRIASLLGDIELTTGYGMSETSGSSTVTAPDDPSERREHTNGKLRVVGAAGQGTEDGYLVRYRVIDGQTRTDAAPGSVGELVCAGIGVTKGYYKKPEETAATIDADGWLHTGDLGYFDEQGYLVLVGRVKETFRTGGEQVMPKEVEDIIALLPEVAQVHVVPLPDPRAGEVGVAYVVARDGFSIDPDAVIAHCQDRLARFKIPRHVRIITADEVPTTPSGRPRKFLLAERARDEIAGGVS